LERTIQIDSLRGVLSMTNKSFSLSVIIILVAIASIVIVSKRDDPVVIRTNLEKMPMKIAGYSAKEDFFSDAVYDELNADKHVYRHYTNSSGGQIDLYIGYYGTARGGRTPHNPYACLPSQGWSILDTGKIVIQTNYAPGSVSLNYAVSSSENYKKYMIHWYQSARTKVLDSGFKRNVQRFVGKILQNRNDGAYVQVSIIRMEAVEDLPGELTQFAQNILNLLPEYWPEEQ
jgi:EpsI family protein